MVNKEETLVRYWKDNIKNFVDQYLMEFFGGVKRIYIYSYYYLIFVLILCQQDFVIFAMIMDIRITKRWSVY